MCVFLDVCCQTSPSLLPSSTLSAVSFDTNTKRASRLKTIPVSQQSTGYCFKKTWMWKIPRCIFTPHSQRYLLNIFKSQCKSHVCSVLEGRNEMFYLTTHSTHFIYGYMTSDIWLRTILIVRKESRCRHISYFYRLTARVLLYAPSHRQDSTHHSLCYTSRRALAGTRNSSMGPPHEGSIWRPITPWANALTTELHLAAFCAWIFWYNKFVRVISHNKIMNSTN